MKIALTASLSRIISRSTQGGTETFVYLLADELVKRGHDVDIYTVADSKVPGNKITVLDKPYKEDNQVMADVKTAQQTILKELAGSYKTFAMLEERLSQYDVVHNSQCDFYSLIKTSRLRQGISTMHIPMDDIRLDLASQSDQAFTQGKFIAISDWQVESNRLPFFDRVYNGVQLDDFSLNLETDNYLAWLGRISQTKGLVEAIDLARATKTAFKFAGSVWDINYFNQANQFVGHDDIEFLGQADPIKRNQLFGRAKAFLFPLQWDEPFGLVYIEAMACGTPVITYDRGAAKEIVIDGVTGYVCPPNDTTAMKEAIHKIMSMPSDQYQEMRRSCRQHVAENFTIQKMVDGYEEVYQRITAMQE